MTKRKQIPRQSQKELLIRSGRRCCLCYGLYGDSEVKNGQIAHIDRDPSNPDFDNLAWLCLDHHDQYDTRPSQTKRLTSDELKEYRQQLFEAVAQFQEEQKLERVERDSNWNRATPERLKETFPPLKEQKTEEQQRRERELQSKLDNSVVFELENEATISSEIERAENLIAEGEHGQVAEIFARLASRLAENKQSVQARKFAKRASREYLEAENKQAAAEQLILAAESWLAQTTYEPLLARRDLEEAAELAVEGQNYTLQARAVVSQAYLYLANGDLDKCETLWQKADSLLPKVSNESRIKLYCELALQRAMCARLAEDYEDALQILREADKRDWSPKSRPKRLELLWVLMYLEAEIGDWEAVDQTYQKAQAILQVQADRLQEGAWLMHYAGTLARRGEEKDAYETYMEAMDRLEKARADVYQKHHLYQDMSHMLLRYADFEISAPIISYDSRRLDLALNVLHETQSVRHVQRARQRYLEGKVEEAVQYLRSALALAWRKGSWSSMAQAYRDLAFLYAANEQPIEAMFAAIRAGNDKMVREYAEQAASIADKEHAQQAVAELLSHWPSLPEQCSALVGLTYSADIISSDFLSPATDFALDVLAQSSQQSAGREARRRAAELLHELAPRLNRAHTNRVLQVCVDRLPEARPLLNQMELLRVMGACFENKHTVDVSLTESVLRTLLSLRDSDALRNEFEAALLQLGRNSSGTVRAQVVAYFRQQSDWIRLAALKEPVPEEEVRATIEKVLASNTPRWEEGSISYGGWRAQSITSFNEILSTSLHALVVDGLLEAATNADGFANQRSETIRTLRWLPEEAIRERADRIAVILFGICDNVDNENESDKGVRNFLGGPSNQLLQSSLYTLGHLYEWSSAEIRQRTLERILSSSDHNDELVRTGAAMALRRIKGSEPLPFQIVMAHERLLADHEAVVRHWAGAATGHLIIQPLSSEQNAGYFAERLAKLVLSEEDSFARSGMACGLRVIADNQEDSLPESVSHALEQLANDVSFQVRYMAKPKREEG